MPSGRNAASKTLTFLQFALQQRAAAARIAAELPPASTAGVMLDAGETEWKSANLHVTAGQHFSIAATGAIWLSKPLSIGIEPRVAVWVRIGGAGPIRKIGANTYVFEAWATGMVEIMAKGLSEWAGPDGALLPGKRKALAGGIAVTASLTVAPASVDPAPAGWAPLWRMGEGRIFTGEGTEIDISTHGDVGILCRETDTPVTATTRLDWSWLITDLPSRLPEDLAPTHDYLSIAVEFDNGRDLTFMWSAALKPGHAFACPLGWWCDRETHFVVRSGQAGLGEWQTESRTIAADYAHAIGGEQPARIVKIWLIANSVFQRRAGRARFRNIALA